MEKIKDVKLAMIVASSSALTYLDKNKNADIEEVIRYVIGELKAERDAKIAGIAAVNYILKYKQKNPRAGQKEIMQNLANSANEIFDSIKDEIKEM